MNEPVNKVCATCTQACKQAFYVKVIACPKYTAVKKRDKTVKLAAS